MGETSSSIHTGLRRGSCENWVKVLGRFLWVKICFQFTTQKFLLCENEQLDNEDEQKALRTLVGDDDGSATNSQEGEKLSACTVMPKELLQREEQEMPMDYMRAAQI